MLKLLALWAWLRGKKTYFLGIATILYAGFGYWKGFMTGDQAMQMVSAALLAMGIRHGQTPSSVVGE